MYTLEYVSPDGELVPLIGGPYRAVFVSENGIDGLVGAFEDTGTTLASHAGRVVDFRDRVVAETTGSLTVLVKNPELWSEFIGSFHTRREGRLVLRSERQRWELPVRLSSSFAAPMHRPKVGLEVNIPLVSDRQVWVSVQSGEGSVLVVNNGDVAVWPRVSWIGDGGKVTLPSGASFTLPKVLTEHSVSLSRRDGGVVTNTQGGVSRSLTDSVGALSECVPVDSSREFVLPKGARLSWELGVFNPWL